MQQYEAVLACSSTAHAKSEGLDPGSQPRMRHSAPSPMASKRQYSVTCFRSGPVPARGLSWHGPQIQVPSTGPPAAPQTARTRVTS